MFDGEMGLNPTFVEAAQLKTGVNVMLRKLCIMTGLVAILAVSASDFAAARVASRGAGGGRSAGVHRNVNVNRNVNRNVSATAWSRPSRVLPIRNAVAAASALSVCA